MTNEQQLSQHIIKCLAEGGLENLLQDMTESPYPFTKEQLKQFVTENNIEDSDIEDWDQYDTINPEPQSQDWLDSVQSNYNPIETFELALIFTKLK